MYCYPSLLRLAGEFLNNFFHHRIHVNLKMVTTFRCDLHFLYFPDEFVAGPYGTVGNFHQFLLLFIELGIHQKFEITHNYLIFVAYIMTEKGMIKCRPFLRLLHFCDVGHYCKSPGKFLSEGVKRSCGYYSIQYFAVFMDKHRFVGILDSLSSDACLLLEYFKLLLRGYIPEIHSFQLINAITNQI